jgi:hypothetical protein
MSAKQTKKASKAKSNPKAKAKPKPSAKKAAARKPAAKGLVRRPSTNPSVPAAMLDGLTQMFNGIKEELGEYAAHLRPLDRKRLNSVGVKIQGFVEDSYEFASETPEFMPPYLSMEKYTEDYEYFTNFKILLLLCKQVEEYLWNLTLQAADMVYTDSLEYYVTVHEAYKRRIDGAETIYNKLKTFFKRKKSEKEEITEEELKRDVNALLHSKSNGKITIENVKPNLTGGKHIVTDEKFEDSARFKVKEDGEIED